MEGNSGFDWQAFLDVLVEKSGQFNSNLWAYVVLPFIIFLGVYFSFRTKFIQFRRFPLLIRLTIAKQAKGEEGVSSLQALLTALGGRVGGGNLAGVGIALFMGGPGALFWMVLIALLMMVVAMVEITLGQMYKQRDSRGKERDYLSGPPFYMNTGLGQKIIPVLFATCIAIQMSAWNGLQASYLDTYFTKVLNTGQMFNSVFLVLVLGTIIAGGAKWIIKACEKVVPIMAAFYLCLAVYVILTNFGVLPELVVDVVRAGLGFDSALGGATGWAFASVINNGVRRGIYSNEGGVGSMPTIGGISHVKHPTKQGLVDALGVFFDTVIICTATGIIILTSGVLGQEAGGGSDLGGLLIQKAFAYHFGEWAGYYLIFAFFTFSSTSIIANHMIGEMNLKYMSHHLSMLYKVWGVGIIAYGTVSSVSGIVHLADILMGLSVTMHVVSLFLLRNKACATIHDYEVQLKNLPKGSEPIYRPDKKELDSPLWN